MQATIYDLQGQALDTVELNDAIFGIEPNIGVVHQAVLRQQANARLGTHNTLTRADVSGGGRKPWKQKGTGRARQGSTRSPQWRHGGVVFGPHPRSYVQALPRKMRRLAMRSVLSAKAADGQILIIDSFEALEPRTKAMIGLLATLNLTGRRLLIMTPEAQGNLELAMGNLPRVSTTRTRFLNLIEMLKSDVLILDRASLTVIESILGQTGGRNSRPVEAPVVEGAAPRRMPSPLDGETAPAAGVTTTPEYTAAVATALADDTPVAAGDTALVDDEPAGVGAESSITVTPTGTGTEEAS
ncbi:MAG TPA: 50S ribosomal protein L4 [Chloroflexia bacterium]|nr:50S ribosomal protein L4 [Chloroflexia bacterium]